MMIDTTIRRIMKPNQPAWLASLQNDMALLTHHEAGKIWPGADEGARPYFNFRMEYTQQVERDALRLLETVPADVEILIAAVWIQDRYRPQFAGEQHAARAAQWARENLAGLGFPADKVETVAFAVARHADPPGAIPEQAVEARLLWDSGRLAQLGAASITGALLSAPAFPEQKNTYAQLALRWLEDLERARRAAESLYFEAARQIAGRRYQQQKAFTEAFSAEVGA